MSDVTVGTPSLPAPGSRRSCVVDDEMLGGMCDGEGCVRIICRLSITVSGCALDVVCCTTVTTAVLLPAVTVTLTLMISAAFLVCASVLSELFGGLLFCCCCCGPDGACGAGGCATC